MTFAWMHDTLEDLRQKKLFRSLRSLQSPSEAHVRIDGRLYLNLASNNYLGLANHPRLVEAVCRAVQTWGWGAGASQLVTGFTTAHETLCRQLAAFEGTEDCVLFPTGYQANVGTLTALVGEGDRILLDKLCHASLIDGARLSGADLRVYPHATLEKLARLLTRDDARRVLVVTDTVFSMDGDLAPLPELVRHCQAAGAMLLVDEAHATGVVGTHGGGACDAFSLTGQVPLVMGTLSKALGGIGGFVCASRIVCDHLRNHARGTIYTTALPPAAAVAACEALALLHEEPWRRDVLHKRMRQLRTGLAERGIRTPETASAILPLRVGDADTTLDLAAALLDEGILCPAIRPPTVPPNTSRLRLSLMATHTEEDIARVAQALRNACDRIGWKPDTP